jgi:hypothetical protein
LRRDAPQALLDQFDVNGRKSLITGGSPLALESRSSRMISSFNFQEVVEDVILPPQLAGDHWRPAFHRGYDGDANPATLQASISDRKSTYLMEVIGQLHRVGAE